MSCSLCRIVLKVVAFFFFFSDHVVCCGVTETLERAEALIRTLTAQRPPSSAISESSFLFLCLNQRSKCASTNAGQFAKTFEPKLRSSHTLAFRQGRIPPDPPTPRKKQLPSVEKEIHKR